MKTVENKTPRPLRLPLPRGKTLFLGPLKSGQIAANAAEHPPLMALVEAGQIEIHDPGKSGPAGHESGPSPHASTTVQGGRAVQPPTKKGERGA